MTERTQEIDIRKTPGAPLEHPVLFPPNPGGRRPRLTLAPLGLPSQWRRKEARPSPGMEWARRFSQDTRKHKEDECARKLSAAPSSSRGIYADLLWKVSRLLRRLRHGVGATHDRSLAIGEFYERLHRRHDGIFWHIPRRQCTYSDTSVTILIIFDIFTISCIMQNKK